MILALSLPVIPIKFRSFDFVIINEISELLPDQIEPLIRIFKNIDTKKCKIIQIYSHLDGADKLVLDGFAGIVTQRSVTDLEVHCGGEINDSILDFILPYTESFGLIPTITSLSVELETFKDISVLIILDNPDQRDLVYGKVAQKLEIVRRNNRAGPSRFISKNEIENCKNHKNEIVIHLDKNIDNHSRIRQLVSSQGGVLISILPQKK